MELIQKIRPRRRIPGLTSAWNRLRGRTSAGQPLTEMPCLPVAAGKVQTLDSPVDYRETILALIAQAKKRTGERASRKLTKADEHGRLRFIEQPPTMRALEPARQALQAEYLERYLHSASADIRLQLRHYTAVDAIRRHIFRA